MYAGISLIRFGDIGTLELFKDLIKKNCSVLVSSCSLTVYSKRPCPVPLPLVYRKRAGMWFSFDGYEQGFYHRVEGYHCKQMWDLRSWNCCIRQKSPNGNLHWPQSIFLVFCWKRSGFKHWCKTVSIKSNSKINLDFSTDAHARWKIKRQLQDLVFKEKKTLYRWFIKPLTFTYQSTRPYCPL